MTDPIVALCCPVYGQIPPEAAFSMIIATQAAMEAGAGVQVHATMQLAVDKARNLLTERALNSEATHIMWVDSDIVLPADAIIRLLNHQVPVASGLYHFKHPPYGPMAFMLDPDFIPLAGVLQNVKFVDAVGFGCVLIETDVFRQMSEFYNGEPWFDMTLYEGEDVFFFRRYRAMGGAVVLDPTVRCGHVGTHMVTPDDAWTTDRERPSLGFGIEYGQPW